MNERIKELAIQSGGDPEALVYFAELIIEECIDVIKKEVSMKYKDGGEETEEFMGGHYAASVLARVKIKQHFGVK